ncbi:MAG: CAP domain-containing protein [Janthinobacterium lividum]
MMLALLGLAVPAFAQHSVAEQYLFSALNASRAAAGLPCLAWSDELTRAAKQHADWMSREAVVAHRLDQEADLPERAASNGARFSAVAENVGVSASAVDMQEMWEHSADHRQNMLDPAVNSVGIAVRQQGDEVWAVEDFASTSTALALLEQEDQVRRLLLTSGMRSAGTADARAMCRTPSGYVGRRPDFVMRFNATELTHLPAELEARLRRGGLSNAAVGACDYPQSSFASYSIAVALYR